ncbi:hypothetical protein [Promicromonospora soli]
MSSDSDVPPSEGGETTERMDRLRALLTKPIKIPESASSDSEDADYAAPVAAAAPPKGAKTSMTSQGTTPKGAKAPVETPPAVKAAAEALDRLTDEEKEAVVDGAAKGGKSTRSRRTWADAYLAKPDKPLTPEEVRAELTIALKEQGTELRELVAKEAAAQAKAQARALEETLEQAREKTVTDVAASVEQAAATASAEAARLQARIDELATTTDTLRSDLDAARAAAAAARTAADSAASAAATARGTADAATKKAATATTFAWVGIALALVAAVVAVVM